MSELGELASLSVSKDADGDAILKLYGTSEAARVSVPEEWVEPLRSTCDDIDEIYGTEPGQDLDRLGDIDA